MYVRKFLSIFLIGLVFAIAGCSSDSTSGISDEDRLPDTDGDGTVDKHEDDIDGDGIVNKNDTDDDGDGIPDADDSTPNGDGGEAPTPGLACTSAKVLPPRAAITGFLTTVSWKLLPEGCELGVTVSSLLTVTASAGGKSTESDPASLGELTSNIVLPHDCTWSGKQTTTYDFSAIGSALGDTSSDYEAEREAIVGNPPNFRCGPCKSAVIDWPTANTGPGIGSVGYSQVDWLLFPEGCTVTDAMRSALPTGWDESTTTTGEAQRQNPNGSNEFASRIKIPCAPNAPEGTTGKRVVKYEFITLAMALGDLNFNRYGGSVTHGPATSGCDGDD